MSKVLIFGENSYIGSAFAAFAANEFDIGKISSRKPAYETKDFSEAECVLYCAGIAHRKAADALYFEINYDLALRAAQKAKEAGVKQFVYLSSAAVLETQRTQEPYRPHRTYRTQGTQSPRKQRQSAYGESKLKAETELNKLADSEFIVSIIRPPMVYGKGCKGNFNKLAKLARVTPIFPDYPNKRSMIYIDNLCYFLTDIIKNKQSGTFFPQNKEPAGTARLVRLISQNYGRNIKFTKIFNGIIPLCFCVSVANKLFSDFVYEGRDSVLIDFVGLEESVKKSL